MADFDWFKFKKVFKLVRELHRADGTVPEKAFPWRLIDFNNDNVPISDGNAPVKRLYANCNEVKAVSPPRVCGKV